MNKFLVPNLHECNRDLTKVASKKIPPQLVLTNARIISTYTDRILRNKEIWIYKGRIACIKNSGEFYKFNKDKKKNYL